MLGVRSKERVSGESFVIMSSEENDTPNNQKPFLVADNCTQCGVDFKTLGNDQEESRLYFVETEVARCFCSQECIQDYFTPVTQVYVDLFSKALKPHAEKDFDSYSQSKFKAYQALTLEEPDAVETITLDSGDKHYIYSAHFELPKTSHLGSCGFEFVVACLSIQNIPSFVFIGFATKEPQVKFAFIEACKQMLSKADVVSIKPTEYKTQKTSDVLSDTNSTAQECSLLRLNKTPHSDAEAFRKLYIELKQVGDLEDSEFAQFDKYLDDTVDDPDEVWSFQDKEGRTWLSFIKEQDHAILVVLCNEAAEPRFAFPTLDHGLVKYFKAGDMLLNRTLGVRRTRLLAA